MTKEKAVLLLDNLIGLVEDSQSNDYDSALKIAIRAIKKEDKYRWHDLRKNPDDLPVNRDSDEWYECVHANRIYDRFYPSYQYNAEKEEFGAWGMLSDRYEPWQLVFVDSKFHTVADIYGETIIAWREIEQFKE